MILRNFCCIYEKKRFPNLCATNRMVVLSVIFLNIALFSPAKSHAAVGDNLIKCLLVGSVFLNTYYFVASPDKEKESCIKASLKPPKQKEPQPQLTNSPEGLALALHTGLANAPETTVRCFRKPGGVFAAVHEMINGPGGSEICYDFLRKNPWANESSIHTHLTTPLVQYLFEHAVKNGYWVEVGSFRGGSALKTVEVARKLGKKPGDFVVHCIDPWTGDVSMWHHLRPWIDVREGRPHLMDQFIHTVLDSDTQEYIVPQQTTSIVGLRSLLRHAHHNPTGIRPDVVYLDSAHELDETYVEAVSAYKIVRKGGFLVGDDFDRGWMAVVKDITRFALELPCSQNSTSSQSCSVPWPDALPDWQPTSYKKCTGLEQPPETLAVLRITDQCQWLLRAL